MYTMASTTIKNNINSHSNPHSNPHLNPYSFCQDRFDIILQFIINYITSCGLHGSCWIQIQHAINQIINCKYQQHSPQSAKSASSFSLAYFWPVCLRIVSYILWANGSS